jgi:ABC-type nickel/cobalt efflux system permease component RcnA
MELVLGLVALAAFCVVFGIRRVAVAVVCTCVVGMLVLAGVLAWPTVSPYLGSLSPYLILAGAFWGVWRMVYAVVALFHRR